MTRHTNVLDPAQAMLVICDLQNGFSRVIHEFDKIAARSAIVIEAATLLNLPILVTEQYPQRLGATVEMIQRALPESVIPVGKTAFSCCGADGFVASLAATGRKQVMLAGIESHVCMSQTAHDLLALGYQVHLLTDCASSRTPENRQLGIDKMIESGAVRSGCEMALFELMRDAQHEQFKAISKLIK